MIEIASRSRHLRKPSAGLLWGLVLASTVGAAAGTSEKEQSWDALVAEARKHGGEETKLDRTASYVFQRPDGSFVTLTRMLDGSRRAVCAINGEQNVTVCGDWDSGKVTWSERKDVASPWVHHDKVPDATELAMKQVGSAWSYFLSILGHARFSQYGNLYWPN